MFSFTSGRTANALSRWTSISHVKLRIAPGREAIETVTIRVPRHTSPGARYAVIWAEMSAPAKNAASIRLVNRVGVRVYVTTTGPSRAETSTG